MRNIYIIEDQPIIAENLKRIVLSYGHKVLGVSHSYEDALEKIQKLNPQLILVDINLGPNSKNGIDLVAKVKSEINPDIRVIFITANSDSTTIKLATQQNPNGYIVKPFQNPTINSTIEVVFSNLESEISQDIFIEVRKKDQIIKLNSKDILFIQSDGVYSDIFTKDNKKYTKREYLKNLIELLPEDSFIRTHKSYVANKYHVESFNNTSVSIANNSIPIGRAYKEKVLAAL